LNNPNVFVICMLKHSDNTISRRQEVGRGLRLSVNQSGDRMDHPATVHDINVLTVVASESYKEFVTNLQKESSNSLSARPRKADEAYHTAKAEGRLAPLPPELAAQAEQIYKLIDSVFSESQLPQVGDDRKPKANPLNDNFNKREFKELWNRINHKAIESNKVFIHSLVKYDLLTIFELNKRYGFTKFVIVVPSVAIKEGVYKTLQITEEHFKGALCWRAF